MKVVYQVEKGTQEVLKGIRHEISVRRRSWHLASGICIFQLSPRFSHPVAGTKCISRIVYFDVRLDMVDLGG